MRIEIRDVESSMVYDIGPNGAILGREAARSDIPIRDDAISKRHARIFVEDGAWFLEDLGSSNGTFVDSRRIKDPVSLHNGTEFSLSQRVFQVVSLEGEGPDDPADPNWFQGGAGDETGEHFDDHVSGHEGFGDQPSFPDASYHGDDEDEAPAEFSVGYFMKAVPKAAIMYLAAAPILALNPIGTIKKGIAEQKHPPMERFELIAYAIPAMVFSGLVPVIAAFIAMLLNGSFAIGGLIGGLITGIIGGIVGGVISGIIWHPLVGWVVNFLKGESNQRSRTNYAIMVYTAIIVVAIPQGVGVVVGAIPLPILPALGPLLMLVASLVMAFLSYSWVKAFRLVKWVEYVVMVLAVLTVLGGVANFGTTLYTSVATFLADDGSDSAVATGDDVDPDAMEGLTDEQKEAIAKAKALAAEAANGTMTAEEAAKKAEELQKAAMAQAKDAMDAAKDATDKAEAMAKDAEDKAAAMAKDAEDKAAAMAKDAEDKAAAMAKDAEDKAAAMAKDTTKEADPPIQRVAPDLSGKTPFEMFLAKRNAVEKAFQGDPKLIKRRDLRQEYSKLWRATYEIREKYRKRKGPRWQRDKILSREKDLEIFRATRGNVNKLHKKLFGN